MSTLYNASICISQIHPSKLRKGDDGKVYLDIGIWVDEAVNQFGKYGSIALRRTKEEKAAGQALQYVARLEKVDYSGSSSPSTTVKEEVDPITALFGK